MCLFVVALIFAAIVGNFDIVVEEAKDGTTGISIRMEVSSGQCRMAALYIHDKGSAFLVWIKTFQETDT